SYFLMHPAPAATAHLSLHAALPIFGHARLARGRIDHVVTLANAVAAQHDGARPRWPVTHLTETRLHLLVADRVMRKAGTDSIDIDRKSTRLNSSHVKNSYAVSCMTQ